MVSAPERIDLGCGPSKRDGFYGVDAIAFDGVDLVLDLGGPWPWGDETVSEYHCSHVLEHFDAAGRAHLVNEMHRTLKPGGAVTLIVPHGLSERYYGDPTHQWPPVTPFWFYYLSREWREANAPHTSELLRCNFRCTWGYALHPELATRSQDFQQFATQWYANAIADVHCTMIKE